jgi:hypothetical protein
MMHGSQQAVLARNICQCTSAEQVLEMVGIRSGLCSLEEASQLYRAVRDVTIALQRAPVALCNDDGQYLETHPWLEHLHDALLMHGRWLLPHVIDWMARSEVRLAAQAARGIHPDKLQIAEAASAFHGARPRSSLRA